MSAMHILVTLSMTTVPRPHTNRFTYETVMTVLSHVLLS